jgi:fatty-acid desaturase
MTPSEIMPFILLFFGDAICIFALLTLGVTTQTEVMVFWMVLCTGGCIGITLYRKRVPA